MVWEKERRENKEIWRMASDIKGLLKMYYRNL